MVSFSKYICSFLPEILLLVSSCNVLYVLVCTHFVITPFSEVEICREVFNVSEFHFSEVYFFQTWYFSKILYFQQECALMSHWNFSKLQLWNFQTKCQSRRVLQNFYKKQVPSLSQNQVVFVASKNQFPIPCTFSKGKRAKTSIKYIVLTATTKMIRHLLVLIFVQIFVLNDVNGEDENFSFFLHCLPPEECQTLSDNFVKCGGTETLLVLGPLQKPLLPLTFCSNVPLS